MCVHDCVCVRVHACMHVCVCAFVHACVWLCVHACMHVCLGVHVCIHTVCKYKYVFVHVCVCMPVCLYVFKEHTDLCILILQVLLLTFKHQCRKDLDQQLSYGYR